jgi:hypothetical protein
MMEGRVQGECRFKSSPEGRPRDRAVHDLDALLKNLKF